MAYGAFYAGGGTGIDQMDLSTHTEDKSNPHGVTASQVGALPTAGGGTVYGHIKSVLGGSPSVQSAGGGYVGAENGAYVEAYNDVTDVYGERRQIVLVPPTKDSDIKTALRIAELQDGAWSSQYILHTGNKSFISPQDVGAATNPNLLDNWYFVDPINQRGQSEYTLSGTAWQGYTIDRWFCESGNGTYTLTEDGVKILNNNTTGLSYFRQFFESIPLDGTYTFSALARGYGTGGFIGVILDRAYTNYIYKTFESAPTFNEGNFTLISFTFDTATPNEFYQAYIRSPHQGGWVEIMAAKLERGSTQTLARQDSSGNWVLLDPPPNKHMELLKCCMSTADSTDTYANNYRTMDAISRVCTFSFINDNSTYQARTGMMWKTWIDSPYNKNKVFSYSGSAVYHTYCSGCEVLDSSNQYVNSTDIIIPFEKYWLISCCFIAGTQVLVDMDGNTRAIETLTAGDFVVSYNIKNDTSYVAKVKKLIVNQNTTDMAEITFANGSTIVQNAYHAIYCDDGFHSITQYNGYKELIVGDNAKTIDGWSEVIAIRRYTSDPIVTYNLNVVDIGEDPDDDTNDTYYANGIVVHNAGCK